MWDNDQRNNVSSRASEGLDEGVFVVDSNDQHEISYGFLLSRIWQFMCGSIAYELSEGALQISAPKNYKLLPNEDDGERVPTQAGEALCELIPEEPRNAEPKKNMQCTGESKFFIASGVLPALICVVACYAFILGTQPEYLSAPSLDSIDPNSSKIRYAIEWNLREDRKVYFKLPCGADKDTQLYTNFKEEPQLRCIAINYKMYKCKPVAGAKKVRHPPFVAPIDDLKTDLIFNQFQSNVDFFKNFSKHIVIDMPYYKYPALRTAAVLAKRLQLGLPPGDDLIVTWEALFHDGLFYTYDPETFLARLGDGSHMTPVGLELLRPLYSKILNKLLAN
ncbi:hypothetical protein ANCCEY_03611 [Ancylostoma ceylanicum]|uniref:SGNH domain-containing protein n=1 Tax=Ancylostoma ceylanicum TaxID=53326 RepID=A0A0D6LZS4_9BILA|nr:hypothetical protein ANCCEY_03611 [Ancylostoma ceylanicum]